MAEPTYIKEGSVTIPVYELKNRGKPLFCVAYYHAGRRLRKNFADFKTAKDKARSIARKIHTGEQQALKLTDTDRAAYIAALEALKPTGKRLEIAAAEYADAFKTLHGANLNAAAQFYAKHHSREIPATPVAVVLKEMLEIKRADGASELHLKDIRRYIGRFASTFQSYIGTITTGEIDDYLRQLKVGARTRKNHRDMIGTFFRFARSRGYLPKGQATEADSLAKARIKGGEVGIFTPDQISTLLQHADGNLLPFIALGAFAGIRHQEILRLSWEDVNFVEGHILLTSEQSKTASRRIVPIQNNLAEWLHPYHGRSGKVALHENMDAQLKRLCKTISKKTKRKFSWVKNGLRHSYGSYRLALIKDAARVSLEMGNSPQMIFRCYREVVTEKEAGKWFSIFPTTPAKVISFTAKSA